MWDFNKVGRKIEEVVLHRGLIANLTKVWPWKRKQLSNGQKYLVTVTSPQGIEVYNHYHTHKVLFSYVVNKYRMDVSPLRSIHDEIDVHAFSLETAVEEYYFSLADRTPRTTGGNHPFLAEMHRPSMQTAPSEIALALPLKFSA